MPATNQKGEKAQQYAETNNGDELSSGLIPAPAPLSDLQAVFTFLEGYYPA
ncbi:MAG: hypothetical protein JNL57_14110 [Bacteroidetes bacterium]|nr:hypothetical protein [Bacteroidota bacterium]